MLYVSKPTPAERNAGCDGLPVSRPDNRTTVGMGTFDEKGVAAQQNAHPTVKPIALIRHLQRLVTQPGGITLDPFMGSGTGAVAATLEGFRWVGCELTEDYLPIIRGRVSWAEQEMRAGRSEKPSYKKVEQQQWTEPTLFE
jgi:site-specific DNA-methyltransferase (adenine-specific)